MSDTAVVIVDTEGLTFNAQLEPATADTGEDQTLLRLSDGTQFLVPTELLTQRPDGRYDLHLKLREYATQTQLSPEPEDTAPTTDSEGINPQHDASTDETADTVVPVVEERLKVGKRQTVQNRVHVHKYVTERTETADVPLLRQSVKVEHVRVGRPVDEAAPARFEGDTMIVPLYEEVLVVSKQLMLVEEVRITTERSERHDPQEVTLRREEVKVERTRNEPESNDA